MRAGESDPRDLSVSIVLQFRRCKCRGAWWEGMLPAERQVTQYLYCNNTQVQHLNMFLSESDGIATVRAVRDEVLACVLVQVSPRICPPRGGWNSPLFMPGWVKARLDSGSREKAASPFVANRREASAESWQALHLRKQILGLAQNNCVK